MIVAGATGFAGALAARLVWRHPGLELAAVTSRSDAGRRLDDLYPRHAVPLELTEIDVGALDRVDAAIVAYPHGASAPLVAALLDREIKVVDLSADFRLSDPHEYESWYGQHGAAGLFGSAVYGLTELARDKVRDAVLVANPGCYPTTALLALAPLARAGLIGDVVVDAKSGVSGAGRGGGEALQFTNVAENFKPYRVEGHRHRPELAEQLAVLGATGGLTFTPHLLPLDQGLLASCYVTPTRSAGAEEVAGLFHDAYDDEAFVEVTAEPPGVADVRETNCCRIHATVDGESARIMVFAALDNLWKGAAGQAVQNLNLMLGIEETAGLQ